MANSKKLVTGPDGVSRLIELTDDEQAELNKLKAAYVEGTELKATKRLERNTLLQETDWMASSDYTISDAWKTYRQALRDLPANNKNASWDGTTLGNVSFPKKPS